MSVKIKKKKRHSTYNDAILSLDEMTFEPAGTFVDRRLPVDSVDPVLMARQDRLQGHSEAMFHICSRAKALIDSANDKQACVATRKRTSRPAPPPGDLVSRPWAAGHLGVTLDSRRPGLIADQRTPSLEPELDSLVFLFF